MKQGDYIVREDDKRKILGICGEVVFLSELKDFDVFAWIVTKKELETLGWKVEEKDWEPQFNEVYYYISPAGIVRNGTWYRGSMDEGKKEFMGVFPTKEAAEKRLAEIKSKLK